MKILYPLVLFAAVTLNSACTSLPAIPAPTLQIAKAPGPIDSNSGPHAPRQLAWPWDEGRTFEAEFNSDCRGPIYFVDKQRNISSFVGIDSPPRATFDSDDPDVILGNIGYADQLIFSTNGGRSFFKEVRAFPRSASVEFIAVRKGHVYVGINQQSNDADAYFAWHRTKNKYRSEEMEQYSRKLMILEGKLDKAQGRIASYRILKPKGHQFTSPYAAMAAEYIKEVDDIEALGLPHAGGNVPRHRCDTTMQLPVWHHWASKKELAEMNTWYETTKRAHPEWATAEMDKLMQEAREFTEKYR